MAKHKSDIYDYGQFDDGTYQTGAIHPPRRSSGLVAFLLVLVIFLGGLCSGLGIVNIRLLAQLSQSKQETTPLSQASQPEEPDLGKYLDGLDLPAPQVPQQASLSLQIAPSDYYVQNNTLSTQQIYEQSQDFLVEVHCLTHMGSVQQNLGIVLTSDGFLLTNAHGVDTAKRIFVTLPDGSTLRASLVGSDSFSDLAVLYVDAQDLTPAVFASTGHLQVADATVAIELQDAGRYIRLSTIFSANRTFSTKSGSLSLIQTCSGGVTGPVMNHFGHVIGFQVGHIAQYFPTDDTTGTGLVIPTMVIRQIVQTLISDGMVTGRPSLGIEVESISKVYQQYWQLPGGLLLTDVYKNAHAEQLGLQEGDILLALDGVPVSNRNELYAILYNHNVGDSVIAVIRRDNQQFTVKLTIGDNSQS